MPRTKTITKKRTAVAVAAVTAAAATAAAPGKRTTKRSLEAEKSAAEVEQFLAVSKTAAAAEAPPSSRATKKKKQNVDTSGSAAAAVTTVPTVRAVQAAPVAAAAAANEKSSKNEKTAPVVTKPSKPASAAVAKAAASAMGDEGDVEADSLDLVIPEPVSSDSQAKADDADDDIDKFIAKMSESSAAAAVASDTAVAAEADKPRKNKRKSGGLSKMEKADNKAMWKAHHPKAHQKQDEISASAMNQYVNPYRAMGYSFTKDSLRAFAAAADSFMEDLFIRMRESQNVSSLVKPTNDQLIDAVKYMMLPGTDVSDLFAGVGTIDPSDSVAVDPEYNAEQLGEKISMIAAKHDVFKYHIQRERDLEDRRHKRIKKDKTEGKDYETATDRFVSASMHLANLRQDHAREDLARRIGAIVEKTTAIPDGNEADD